MKQFKRISKECVDEITNHVEAAVHETAEEALLHIKGIGGYGNHRKAKNYRKSFYLKPIKGNLFYKEILANRQYQLTHLLEHGHVVKNKYGKYGSTKAFPHWAETEKLVQSVLEEKLKRKLE